MREKAFWFVIIASIPYLFFNPFYGLLAYCCFNIIRPEMFFWGGTDANRVFFLLYAVSFLGAIYKFRKIRIRSPLNLEIVLYFWICCSLSLSTALSTLTPIGTFSYLAELFKILLICILFVFVIDESKKIFFMYNIFLCVWTFLGLWGIEQSMRGNVRLEGLGGHSFGDSNGVAALFVLFLPIALFKAFEFNDKKEQIIGLFSSAVMFVLIVFTQSRGGFIGLSAAIFWFFILSKNKIRNFIIILLIVIFSLPFVANKITERFQTVSIDTSDRQDGSVMSRLVFWSLAYRLFEQNMLLGVGFNSYPVAKLVYENSYTHLDPDFNDYIFRRNDPFVTHSTYLQVLSEGGLLAFIPFMWLLIRLFTKNRRIRKLPIGDKDEERLKVLLNSIECGIFGFCVCIMFINAILAVFLPIQIIISAVIRNFIYKNFIIKV